MNTLKIFKRKLQISDTVKEMENLENIIYEALSNWGTLDDRQRAIVLKRVVDKNKQVSSNKLEKLSGELIKAEEANDTLKSIMI